MISSVSTTPSIDAGGSLSVKELQTLCHILVRLNTSSSNTSSSAMGLLSNSFGLFFIFYFCFAQTSSYTSDTGSVLTTLDTSQYWILNSGAISHMTGQSKSFTSYSPCSDQDKVCQKKVLLIVHRR